jgi:hypothetical protein
VYQPLNEPELAHVEFIMGEVHGPAAADGSGVLRAARAGHDAYRQAVDQRNWGASPVKRMVYTFRATKDSYVRARGSNLPPGTPYARDMDGNPLADNLRDNIPCDDALCPPHIAGKLDMDVEAWADIWFYANPIFVEIDETGNATPGTRVAVK